MEAVNNRSRILEALGDVVDDISEERLLDILIDSYAAKKRRISELEGENAHERQALHDDRERLREEMRRMRSDPLYGAHGTYFFLCNNRKFRFDIYGRHISMFERVDQYDFAAMQLSQEEWMKSK